MAPQPHLQMILTVYPSSQSPRAHLRAYRIKDIDVELIESFTGVLDCETSFMDLLLALNDLYESEQQNYGTQCEFDLA
jgi:hypothetical protein